MEELKCDCHENPQFLLPSSSSPTDSCGGTYNNTAAEELAAHIVDCASLLACVDVEASTKSIEPISPRGRTVKAVVSWRTAANELRAVEVRFSYVDCFTCRTASGGECVYESLMALLVANNCGQRVKCNEEEGT